ISDYLAHRSNAMKSWGRIAIFGVQLRRGKAPCECCAASGNPGNGYRLIMQIDLNSDLGEGCGLDADLMPLVTSANICCGFHAGDASTTHAALKQAAKHGVQVGAHPGYADREQFGRRELALSEEAIFELCLYQVGALAGLAQSVGVHLRYL